MNSNPLIQNSSLIRNRLATLPLAYAGEMPQANTEAQISPRPLEIIILGLSITSSRGNGHATIYRGLVQELAARGHRVLFLERDSEWRAFIRDLPNPPYCRLALYSTFKQLKDRFGTAIRNADLVVVGSFVHEGAAIGEWVTRVARGITAFYDIDTPVTLAKLLRGSLDYLSTALIPRYQMYLSLTGGPILDLIANRYGSPMARPLYCSVDPQLYYPQAQPKKWDLGYMGTYSEDRQPALDELLLRPACAWNKGRFIVAGPQYPRSIRWPKNVKRRTHIPPAKHRAFYNAQKFTLNITRAHMIETGFSPGARLLQAAACGSPIISDYWPGLETYFEPGREILLAHSSSQALQYLIDTTETERRRLAARAMQRVLASHTPRHRALELESYVLELLGGASKTAADGESRRLGPQDGPSPRELPSAEPLGILKPVCC